MRVAGRFLVVVAGFYLILAGLAYFFQRRLQYFPDTADPALPAGNDTLGVEPVLLRASDGVSLKAWHWPGQRRPTLLLLHGNAGHRGHRLGWMAELHALGYGSFLLDYRGYGGSGGSPTEAGLLRDAEAAARWLAERELGPVVYLGESIGCSVAITLAAQRPPAGLLLHGGALSLAEVAQRAYPFLPVGLLMKDRFDVRGVLARVSCPALFCHGDRDTIVPPDLGRALYEAYAGPKEWFAVPGAGHNDLIDAGGADYYRRVEAFLRQLAP
ncbi:MAG: alpha/beta hydrolase [Planctomycetaceae bacterium]